MSSKFLANTGTSTSSNPTNPLLRFRTLTFLSLRILQSQAPPPNPSCPPLPFLLPALQPPSRPFSTTPHQLKNSKRSSPYSKHGDPQNLSTSQKDDNTEIDIHEFVDYKAAIAKAHEVLKTEVGKVKPGGVGRDLEGLEAVRVILDKGEGEKNGSGRAAATSAKLGDLAQVVPRGGKSVLVLVGEKEHIKLIQTSLSSPPHNLNPQPTPSSPLSLTIPLPPLTAESRTEAAKLVDKRGETALFALREARASQRKRLRALELGKVVGPDELRRAEREVERINEGAVGGVRAVVEEGRKRVLGGGG